MLSLSPFEPSGPKHTAPRDRVPLRWMQRVGLAMLALLIAVAGHWYFLLGSHQRLLIEAERTEQLHVAQATEALVLQIGSMLGEIDRAARLLAELWSSGEFDALERAIEHARKGRLAGAALEVFVADEQGVVRFSHAAGQGEGVPVSVAGRAYFDAAAFSGVSGLYVGRPVVEEGRSDWVVHFSRPIERDGRPIGRVVLGVSPDVLGAPLGQLLSDESDAALLIREDGAYIARSHRFDEIVGQFAPATHPIMEHIKDAGGFVRTTSVVDGVERFYVFKKVEGYPLTVSAGLGVDHLLAPVRAAIRYSTIENVFASALLVVAAASIAWLFVLRERSRRALADSRERLELALSGGGLGSWDWDLVSGRTTFNARWAEMLGYRLEELEPSVATWERTVHPDDWALINAALAQHLAGETESYETEHRVRHREGGWIWVLDRGRVMVRGAGGEPLRMVGTHLDITARKNAERLEEASRERLARLVAEVPGVVYQYLLRADGTSCFPYASPGMLNVYGIDPSEAAASADKVFALIHPADLARVSESIQVSAERLESWRCEYRVRQPDGALRWLQGHANPQRLADGGTLWHGYIQDVTDAHLAAEALQQSEQSLRRTVEAVRDGLWSWEIEGGAIDWDARCFEILGYPDDAMAMDYDRFLSLMHVQDRPAFEAYVRNHFAERPTRLARQEVRLQTAEGAWLWAEVRGRVVEWRDGKPARMVGTLADVSARIAEKRLREALLERSSAAIFTASRERRVVSANASACRIFAQPDGSLSGTDLRRIHWDDAHYERLLPYYDILRSKGHVRFEYPLRDARGRKRWFDISGTPLDPDQADGDVVWTLFDVSDRHRAEAALATERLRLTALIERFPGGVLMEDSNGVVVLANQGLCELFGLAGRAPQWIGRSHDDLCAALGKERGHWLQEPGAAEGGELRRTVEVVSAQGRALEIDWLPISREAERLGRVWLVRDVTEQRQREAELEALAATDTLTSLPNRRSFLSRLERELAEARRRPLGEGAVLMLDIDHFKRVNDTWGHAVGDVVLQHFAEVVRQSLRRGDFAGRLGGEEFAVLLPGAAAEDAVPLADRLREEVARSPAQSDVGPIRITVSIGVAVFDGSGASRLLERADEALYRAKSSGRNRVCLAELDGPAVTG